MWSVCTCVACETKVVLPARMALCAWNSCPATHREQSVKRECSHSPPSSSASLQSGTFTMFIVFCPEMFTESCTTLTYREGELDGETGDERENEKERKRMRKVNKEKDKERKRKKDREREDQSVYSHCIHYSNQQTDISGIRPSITLHLLMDKSDNTH